MTVHKLLLALVLTTATQAAAGDYSRKAVGIFDRIAGFPEKQLRIPSPDGRKSITAVWRSERIDDHEEDSVLLTVRIGHRSFKADIGPGVGAEVLWSPDSNAFFVTTSDEGRNGMYRTMVYFLNNDGLKKIDMTKVVYRAFGHPVKCDWPESPNVAGIKWLAGSRRLLVAAEIVHHSNCDSFGTFKLYEVELPELEITHKYGQIEAKRLFRRDLGGDLMQADDNCVRNPKSCWVSGNHQPNKP